MASILIILIFRNGIFNDLVDDEYIVCLGTTAELERDMDLKVPYIARPDLELAFLCCSRRPKVPWS